MGAFSVYFGDGRWQEGRRTVGGVWSVGSSLASGSRELLAECGLSGQVWRVGQRNCRQSLVCRGEKGEWVKRIVGGVWSVGTSLLRGSKELATACGLSAQVCCVGQENCRRGVVCRVEKGEWVKGIVGGCGLSARKGRVGQRDCR